MIDDKGVFMPNELITKTATQMLDEMHRWAEALRPTRGG
jgi:hypothetical protein